MNLPRVLLITGEYPPLRGGIADYTLLLRDELHEQGVRTFVLSSSGARGRGVSTTSEWGWQLPGVVHRMINQLAIDIVHIQYQAGAFDMHPAVNFLPLLFKRNPNVKTVTTFHDLRAPYLFPKAGRLRRSAVLNLARSSTEVIVTNPEDARDLEEAGIQPQEIPLGPSLPPPRDDAHPNRENVVAFFGFPSREKGIYTLIDTLATLPSATRPALRIVGGSQPDTGTHAFESADAIQVAATRAGVDLSFAGYLPPQAASDELSRCRAVAFPFPDGASLRSSVLIAALNTGTPVVATAIDPANRLNGLAGLPQLVLVKAGDTRCFAAALQRSGTEWIQPDSLPERFTWRSIARQHLDLYRSITGNLR